MQSSYDFFRQELSSAPPFSREEIQWPSVPHSPKNVKHKDFFNKTYDLLSRNVTPEVKRQLTNSHPMVSKVSDCFRSSEKIANFINELHQELSDEQLLNPKDLSKLSALLVENLRDKLVIAICEHLICNYETAEILLEDVIFTNCRHILNTGKQQLIDARQQKNQFVENVQRIEHNNDRRLRRLNGLAELLELDSTHSVCAAITVVNDQVIISANSSGILTNIELATLLRNKWLKVRNFLAEKQNTQLRRLTDFLDSQTEHESELSNGEESYNRTNHINPSALVQYNQVNLELLASAEDLAEFVQELQEISPSTHSHRDSVQNIKKLLKSFYLDIGPFTAEEKSLILTSAPLILLPYVNQEEGVQSVDVEIERFKITAEGVSQVLSHTQPAIVIDGFPGGTRQNHVHCEQMILYFLKEIKLVTSAQIGVSKACCATCNDVFMENPEYQTSATSGQLYPGTVNLESKVKFNRVGSPINYKQDSTRHKPSPHDTPGVIGSASNFMPSNLLPEKDLGERFLHESLDEIEKKRPLEHTDHYSLHTNSVFREDKRARLDGIEEGSAVDDSTEDEKYDLDRGRLDP